LKQVQLQKRNYMKLFLSLIFMFTALTAFAKVGGHYDATGTLKTRYVETETFVNSASGALTRGMAVCLDLTSDDGVAIDLCYAEGAKPVGVIVDTSCAVGAHCKVLTRGYFAYGKFDYAATATVAGGMIYADSDGDLTRPASVT
jgi:hypothetical protein